MKFLIINDFNDINDINITHFSLDKGHFIAKSLVKLGHDVYFLTVKNDYVKNNIKYTFIDNITKSFMETMDYVLIVREPMFLEIIKRMRDVKNLISIDTQNRVRPKFIIKSDSPTWFAGKGFIVEMNNILGVKGKDAVKKWIIDHVDYICAQNDDLANMAFRHGLSKKSVLISNMGVSNELVNYNQLVNPYDINHSYCVSEIGKLTTGKAFIPLYYMENPDKISEFNSKKFIIVYTGRIKTNNGKIFYNMKNIMDMLGNNFELHIFPGTFIMPSDNGAITTHSGKNANSLALLRNTIFKDSKNVIIHYPYYHEEKYKYLYFANCGIDFSDLRPKKARPLAGHAKILEYCEIGLPVVCEGNIHNLFLVKNGKNGIILKYMSSDKDYADAIKKIVSMPIDREYCRKITVQNENWDKKAAELIEQLKNNQ
ncbi:glycosyltransferases group 1 [Tupanvirus soda lake]|uniref:Glycosyltransferases group 1 n=2 Tax=Tupanvirus TaxID=2094720 RepID=A0A6N1NKA2_9VIRU|nr:glycosyltransferases group 1 [Tupanvirus soda lake]QKU35159.1 glycosyltransferases group 1 [Tupanvirus soda lake]